MDTEPAPDPPELLAPAGDLACARAAIENGADAVYFGLDGGFNARARAANFGLEEVEPLVRLLHRRGLAAYAALNTLVFDEEFDAFAEAIRAVAGAGVDAVLVQDVGAATFIRAICPGLPLHASTQMTLTSAETIALAESLGMERVVLARELSIDEIAAIRRETAIGLEVFVHGALCVAYSGQCLTSESLGGRSANRGQCAQACRLPYEVVCDGQEVDLGDRRYLLSPQDLAGHALVPALVRAGVTSLKIEGRLKTPEYVAAVTRHYREAIRQTMAGFASARRADEVAENAGSLPAVRLDQEALDEMELCFSRGFSHGWLGGIDHKALVPAQSSAKRGLRVGTVAGLAGERIVVDLVRPVARGDGLAIACDDPDELGAGPQGGAVWGIHAGHRPVEGEAGPGRFELSFAADAIDPARVRPGQAVWKTSDPRVAARLRRSYESADPSRRRPVDLQATVATGSPIRLRATLDGTAVCEIASEHRPAPARTRPLDAETLRTQLGRLGGTPFELRGLDAVIKGGPMVPLSVLGDLRRRLVEALESLAVAGRARPIAAPPAPPEPLAADPAPAPQLHVLVRSLEQFRAMLDAGERLLAAEFADIRGYREAVAESRAAGASLFLATPRIQKPGEMGIYQSLARHAPDGILARTFSGLRFFRDRGLRVVADFSFNVANAHSAAFFRAAGAERIVPSYDCNREQLLGLVRAAGPAGLEVVIHQRMPMFHMEHCVFCAVLSPGTDRHTCGRPCDDHLVRLRDRIGVEHTLTADVGCRNTLWNATPQSGAEAVGALLAVGVRHFRVELLDEPVASTQGRPAADSCRSVVAAYRDLLAGRATGREVWQRLRAANRIGVTRGTLEARRDPLAIL
jgi:putative protease